MKKQVNPVVTALVILAVLAGVLFFYTKGLLKKKKAEGEMQGGGGMPPAPPVKVGLASVRVTTLAGWAAPGFADGKGWEAKFNGPAGLALAPDGGLYVADSRNHRLRRVSKDGVVTTIAGRGPVDCLPRAGIAGGGYGDGPAGEARFFTPTGMCVGPDGALYVADAGNQRLRRLSHGRVTTVAGAWSSVDKLGFPLGGLRDGPTAQALFRTPVDVTMTPAGELVIADLGNHAFRRLRGSTVSTDPVASGVSLKAPTAVVAVGEAEYAADPEAGMLLVYREGTWAPFPPLTGVAPRRPTALASLPDGTLAVVDAEWNALFAVRTDGESTLLAGTLPPQAPAAGAGDGTGAQALFSAPCAVVADGWTLYVADFDNNCIRKVVVPPNWATPPPPPSNPRERWRRRDNRQHRRRDGDRPGH